MTPGSYIRLRRIAAGLSLGEAARQLAAMQLGLVRLDRRKLLDELERIEADEAALTLAQAVYSRLLSRGALPLPQICRGCGCSWFDPCLPDPAIRGERAPACHWAETDLCSACAEHPSRVTVCAIPIQLAHGGPC